VSVQFAMHSASKVEDWTLYVERCESLPCELNREIDEIHEKAATASGARPSRPHQPDTQSPTGFGKKNRTPGR